MSTSDRRDSLGARSLVLAASFIVVVAGLKVASPLILPILMALFLAMICLPLLNWLQSRRVPTSIALVLTVFAALALMGLIVALVGGSIREFTQEVPRYRTRFEQMSVTLVGWLQARGIAISDNVIASIIDPSQAMDLVTGLLRSVAAALSNAALVLLAVLFILAEAAGFPAKLQAAFGGTENVERYARIRTEIQRYLAIKTTLSLATGLSVAVALALLDVDFPLLWGMMAFLLNFIPNLGSILAAIPPVLLALLQHGLGRAIAVAAVFVAINVLLGVLLETSLMGRRMRMSSLVVFLSLVFWGWVWGPVGMLLSVPLTMIVIIMLENTTDLRWIAVLLGTPKGDVYQKRVSGTG